MERHRPGRDQREQQMEWPVSQSPLRRLLLSGLPRTEDLMAAPRWWEGWNTERTGNAVSRDYEGTRFGHIEQLQTWLLESTVLKRRHIRGLFINTRVGVLLWVVRVPVGELQLCEEHPLENKRMPVRRITSTCAPQAADIISHCALLIASVQIVALIRFN